MGKGKYRAVWLEESSASGLREQLGGKRTVVAVDVAKEIMFAAVVDESGAVHETVKWKHPAQSRAFVQFCRELGASAKVDVAMEPSGVYGDALRFELWAAGFEVYRVSPKRSHDAAEVYDGVPSLHDAKCAAIIAKLHLDGASELWPVEPDAERMLTAALRVLEVHEKEVQRNRNRLEGYLARHWPEVTQILSPDSATLLELLIAYGGPSEVAKDPARARKLMRKVGGRLLDPEKIEAVLNSAKSTFGMPQIAEERRMVQAVAAETRRQQQASSKARHRVEKLTQSVGSAQAMSAVIGKTTAAVAVAGVGDPLRYASAAAYEKAWGLNLKEKSSGQQKGGLHITKRGSGIARQFLYLAVLRLLQEDQVVRAWYAQKVRRDAGKKGKGLVALMRKLARALWNVARGSAFDSTKLFDTTRLRVEGIPLAPASAEAV